jgi:hypothetical protein
MSPSSENLGGCPSQSALSDVSTQLLYPDDQEHDFIVSLKQSRASERVRCAIDGE